MPRARRNNILGVLAFVILIYFLYTSTDSHFGRHTDFRKTTESGIARKNHLTKIGKEYMSDAELTAQTNKDLQNILKKQSETVDLTDDLPMAGSEKKPTLQSPVVESLTQDKNTDTEYEDVSVAGRKTMQKPKLVSQEKPKYPSNLAVGEGEEEALNGGKVEKMVDPGKDAAREELQQILRQSPIIIFSKSRCPYSRRAKALLLETYHITPAPHVVELDLMTDPAIPGSSTDSASPPATMGRKLQDLLAELTGRKTVPNIMIMAQSVGGADEVLMLETEGRLIEEFKRIGGNRIVDMKKVGG